MKQSCADGLNGGHTADLPDVCKVVFATSGPVWFAHIVDLSQGNMWPAKQKGLS